MQKFQIGDMVRVIRDCKGEGTRTVRCGKLGVIDNWGFRPGVGHVYKLECRPFITFPESYLESAIVKTAQSGDTIEVTDSKSKYFGRKMVIIEWPNETIVQFRGRGEVCFLTDDSDQDFDYYYITDQHYKVVSEKESNQTGVDASLRKQRDDNLRDVFG